MQKKLRTGIFVTLSSLGLLGFVFGILILLIPITKSEARVEIKFSPKGGEEFQLSEKDRQDIFTALSEIEKIPAFKNFMTNSGFDVFKKGGHVAGVWTEKVKIISDPIKEEIKVEATGSNANEKILVSVVAQGLASYVPVFIGDNLVAASAKLTQTDYVLPGWLIADLIVGGIFFFFSGLFGIYSDVNFSKLNCVSKYQREKCHRVDNNDQKKHFSADNQDARYWLQKFLDENKSL